MAEESITNSEQLYFEARVAYENGMYTQAIAILEKSTSCNPHYKAYELLAVCLKEVGSRSQAEDAIRRAHELNPKSSKTTVLFAEYLIEKGEVVTAKRLISSLLERHSTYGPAKKLLESLGGLQ